MVIYSGISLKEAAASVYWDACQKINNVGIRVFYDRVLGNILWLTPSDQNYDKIQYDPGRYRYIGQYDHNTRPEFVEQDILKLRSEIKHTRIQSSLGKHIEIMRLEDE